MDKPQVYKANQDPEFIARWDSARKSLLASGHPVLEYSIQRLHDLDRVLLRVFTIFHQSRIPPDASIRDLLNLPLGRFKNLGARSGDELISVIEEIAKEAWSNPPGKTDMTLNEEFDRVYKRANTK